MGSPIVGKTTSIKIKFTTENILTIGGSVQISYPEEIDISDNISVIRVEESIFGVISNAKVIADKHKRRIIIHDIIPNREIHAGKTLTIVLDGVINPRSTKPLVNKFEIQT